MPIIQKDTRLIDGRIPSIAESINEYLSGVSYAITDQDIAENYADIKATNLQRSTVRLYLANSPQIVHFHLEKISDEQIQIETQCDLFRKFRIFYYSFLIILLIASSAFLFINLGPINPISKWESYQSASLAILMSVLCFVSACFFFVRSISTFSYENFLNQLYTSLADKGFSNKVDIHVGHSFPDMWRVFFLIGIFSLPILLCFVAANVIPEHSFLDFFLYGALFTIGILCILLTLTYYQPALKARMFFALAGFSLCMPIAIFFSPPIILSITGNLGEFFAKFLNDGYPQQTIQYGSLFYLVSVMTILAIALFFLINTLQLPIRIAMQLNKSSVAHSKSKFNQSLQAENSFFVFNFLLIFLWGIFWFVKILGLYFTFTILERSFFGSNYLLNSNLAIMFFENVKVSLLLVFQSKFDNNSIVIFHTIIMQVYCIPMIAFVVLIFRKNIKRVMEESSLAGKQLHHFENIEQQISEKIDEICKCAGIRPPLVRAIASTNINAETKFIGFPLFKNVLVVTEGAWTKLRGNEDEFNILLAHEVWHIKKHTLTRRMLCFLSDYSLFGNGFLVLLQNSFQIEKEADDFAVKWMLTKYHDSSIAIDSLKSLLERIEENNWLNALYQSGGSMKFSMLKDDFSRKKFLSTFEESSMLQRTRINI